MRWQINKRVTWRCWLSSVWTGKSETSRSDPSPQTSTASSVDSQQSPAIHQVHHTKLSHIHNHKSPFRATLAYRVALISISVTNIQTPAYAAIPRTWADASRCVPVYAQAVAGTNLYCLRQGSMGADNLPRVIMQPPHDRESNSWPLSHNRELLTQSV